MDCPFVIAPSVLLLIGHPPCYTVKSGKSLGSDRRKKTSTVTKYYYLHWFISVFYPFHNLYFGKHPVSYNNVINFPAVVIIAPTQTVYTSIRWYFTCVQNKTSQRIQNYHEQQNTI